MKQVTQFIEWLRYCCATLETIDSSDKSFEFSLKQTKEALNELRPRPYAGSTCELPPSRIFGLLEKFEQLEKGQIATEEFCSDFRLVLDELERISSSKLALDKFEAMLAELLSALSQHMDVSSELWRLLEAFSALPSKEKERLLLYKK